MEISLKINLTDEQFDKLSVGKSIKASCHLSSKTEKKKAQVLFLSGEVEAIIDHWNNHPVLSKPHIKNEKRNEKYSKRKAQYETNIFDKAFKKYNLDQIKSYIDKYLSKCNDGEHINNQRNIGYGTITGLLRALCSDKKLWWEDLTVKEVDDNPESTFALADAYAKYFLDRSTFGLEIGSTMHTKFIKASKRVDKIYQKVSSKIAKDRFVKLLFACVKDNFDEVFPGHLSNDTVWKIMFPKYLKENLT